MKLRNKKTGEIKSIEEIIRDAFLYNELDSLKSIDANWEYYIPAEPLIKDEKIRKAVRAWAEANNIERVWHECASCWLRGNGLSIEMENEVEELEQGNYTLTELCGEEEKEEDVETKNTNQRRQNERNTQIYARASRSRR